MLCLQFITVKKEIGFVLMRPEAYFPEYLDKVDVDDESIKGLNISADIAVDLSVILTMNHSRYKQDYGKFTRATPLYMVERVGIQVILKHD